jgi:hypothetical protein
MALHVEGIAGSSAGNIIGVGGIDTVVFKIATLSNISCCPTFSPIQFKVTFLVLYQCNFSIASVNGASEGYHIDS